MSQVGQFELLNPAISTITGNVGGAVGPTAGNINIVGGAGVTVTGNPGLSTLTITVASGALTWNEVIVMGPTGMAINNGYVANNAGLVTLTLPAVAAFGSVIRVAGKGAGGWLIAQNAGQTIFYGATSTTPGAGGSLASTLPNHCVELVCITANNDWEVLSSVGNLTVV